MAAEVQVLDAESNTLRLHFLEVQSGVRILCDPDSRTRGKMLHRREPTWFDAQHSTARAEDDGVMRNAKVLLVLNHAKVRIIRSIGRLEAVDLDSSSETR